MHVQHGVVPPARAKAPGAPPHERLSLQCAESSQRSQVLEGLVGLVAAAEARFRERQPGAFKIHSPKKQGRGKDKDGKSNQ